MFLNLKMEIKDKIMYLFVTIVAIIIILLSLAIYISFSKSRKEEFYDRLTQKATLVSQMLIDIDEINIELLRKIEHNNPLSLPNEIITIYDYNNNLIFTSDTILFNQYSEDIIHEVRLKKEIRLTNNKKETIGKFYTGQYDRIVTFVSATDIFGLNKLKRLRLILLIVFCSSLIIVFISGKIFAQRTLLPIKMLMKEVDSIEANMLSIRVNTGNNNDEIAQLATTFNRFLDKLESSIEMQKSFISNASHELRTPLTVLSGQLEVLLRKERDIDEYKQTILTVYDEIKNLSDISNRLLLLAKASAETNNYNFTECRVDEIIWQTQAELKKLHPDYYLNIQFADNIDTPEMLTTSGNSSLLKDAFYNLAENGCKYSRNKTCEIKLETTNNIIQVNFIDSGIGISADELNNIFEPFYRSKNVLNYKGHGIGLSIVEKIISLHKGEILIKSEPENGSIFSILLNISTTSTK